MTTQTIKDTYSDDVRLALLEQSINNINNTLIRFEKRFDQIDEKFDRIDEKFDRVNEKFGRVDANIQNLRTHFDTKIDSNHKWTLGLISGLYLLLSSAFITILIKFIN